MFHTRDIVTAIEIGTSKINVLVGEAGPDGRVNVVGRGSAPSAGSVVKGEIEDMDLAFEQLGNAIADAESASGRAAEQHEGRGCRGDRLPDGGVSGHRLGGGQE